MNIRENQNVSELYEFLYVLLNVYLWKAKQIPNVNEDHEILIFIFDPTYNVQNIFFVYENKDGNSNI